MVEIVTGALIGYRLIKDAKFILSVANYVKTYKGYDKEDNREDDREIRNWIMESINGLKTHAVNLMETGYRNDDDNLEKEAKIMIDNLDLFKNEVNLASGKEAKSVWTKVSDEEFDNLVEFDLKVVEGIDKVDKLMTELEAEISSGGDNKMKLLGDVKSGITESRNHFIQRMQFVGGFK
tara:strand:- start:580 stop:1116 length:537 start_codon:yes stop_codon:yes gene_type:complete